MANYIKLQWYNSTDLARTYYSGGFKNIAIFEADVIRPEYVNEQEAEKNGDGVLIKTSELLQKRFRFEIVAPEYVLDSLKAMALCDNIQLSILKDATLLYQTDIRNVNVNATWDETFNDCFSTIEVTFEQDDQIFNTGCNENFI